MGERKETGNTLRAARKEYAEKQAGFRRLVAAMRVISTASAGRFVEPRKGWASGLFTRLCVLSSSLDYLFPEVLESVSADKADLWDLSSACMIARGILECCLMFQYIGATDVPEEEWQKRINLLHLHDASARMALFEGVLADKKEALALENAQNMLRDRLELLPSVQAIPPKQRKHYLTGNRFMFETQDQILDEMGCDKHLFRSWYEYLSAHLHSFPLAFHRSTSLQDGRGRGIESGVEMRWMTLLMCYLFSILDHPIRGMIKMFPDISDPRISQLPMPDLSPRKSRRS